MDDPRWFAQRAAARLFGKIASVEAVPLLQPLLRKSDPRVLRAAIAALGAIRDPSAARAIQTVLRAATGDARQAVISALVADRDPRVAPMLIRIIEESEPMGKDHPVVLEALAALGMVANDVAAPDSGFEVDTNRAVILDARGGAEELPLLAKTALAVCAVTRDASLLLKNLLPGCDRRLLAFASR